jgi:branched-chain amino acid transport system substrate-binding protein
LGQTGILSGPLGVTRLAAADLDNAGGKEVLQLIEQTTAKEGLTFTDQVLVKPDGSNAQMAGRSLTDAAPQAVLLYLSGALPGGLIDAMRKSGSDAAF